ncbi:MAG: DUF2892 domain-containing protein [Cytophagales bacterium]
MKTNVGKIDKAIRLSLAGIIILLFVLKAVSGTLGWVLLGFAAILIGTSFINFCPIYAVLKIKTNKAQ